MQADEHSNVPQWLIYALGGGMGHLTRAIALAKAAVLNCRRRRISPPRLRIVANSRFAEYLTLFPELKPWVEMIALPAQLDKVDVARSVVRILQQSVLDVLIVDTFPRGLAGELSDLLPEIRCQKFLVHRDLNPRYLKAFRVEAMLPYYDRILVPGESAPFENSPKAVRTSPWLILNGDELLPPDQAREQLRISTPQIPAIVVLSSGTPEEVGAAEAVARQLARELRDTAAVRFVTPVAIANEFDCETTKTVCLWPFLRVVRGVSIIVGAGGYNTVQEARATRTPLIALPQPRLYDRQRRRLLPWELAADQAEIGERVRRLLSRNVPINDSDRPPTRFPNGVHRAVAAIEQR